MQAPSVFGGVHILIVFSDLNFAMGSFDELGSGWTAYQLTTLNIAISVTLIPQFLMALPNTSSG